MPLQVLGGVVEALVVELVHRPQGDVGVVGAVGLEVRDPVPVVARAAHQAEEHLAQSAARLGNQHPVPLLSIVTSWEYPTARRANGDGAHGASHPERWTGGRPLVPILARWRGSAPPGWSYDHWQDVLYPAGTPSRSRLDIYTSEFPTVELNASFYRWPRDTTFAGWRERLPDGFRLSVKAPRGLTHGKRLLDPDVWVQRILAGWHELGDRRAVLLVQLPPGH